MQKQDKPQRSATPQDAAFQRLIQKLSTPELLAVLKRLANK